MFLSKVIRTIKTYDMLEPGDHVVVAVSGGADSMALLTALSALRDRWGLSLTVAHLNHMIRGAQSRAEADFVRACAEELGLPCIVEERDVPAFRKEARLSLQEAAREVRYRFFHDTAAAVHARAVALGHHADDQAETVLMRFLRGAALPGLSGIPPCRGIFIRPLIAITRDEIEAFLKEKGRAFIADSSGAEQQYRRNRLRHHLLPLIKKEYNPRIGATLARTADLLRLDNEMLDQEIERMAVQSLTRTGDELHCAIDPLKHCSPAARGRLMRHVITELKGDMRGVQYRHIEALCRLLEASGSTKTIRLPGGWSARREYDHLVFARRLPERVNFCYAFNEIPAKIRIAEIDRTVFFRFGEVPRNSVLFNKAEKQVAYIDAAQVRFPAAVRTWQPGDRFYPLGQQGSRKLKDFFSDNKVPVRERHRVPILLFQDRVAWICGFRIDERFKVAPDAAQALKVWIE